MAQGRAIGPVIRAVVAGVAACPRVALVRLWLTGPADRCGVCALAPECPERSGCLHLVASAGNPVKPTDDYGRTDGILQRVPPGARAVGEVARAGTPLVVHDPARRGRSIADPAWFEREQVRTFAAEPLVVEGETLGVLALCDRGALDPEHLSQLRFFTSHAAVSLINARAFEALRATSRRLEQENHHLREMTAAGTGESEIVGRSPALRRVLEQIALAARLDTAVLIRGEPGSDKNLVARAIHARGRRASRPMIRVDCATIPAARLGSALFGDGGGGADCGEAAAGELGRIGSFELASDGTLFLDAVESIPPALQPRLFRILQTGMLRRGGEKGARRTTARVIAATGVDLRAEVAAGRFGEGLYQRLSVLVIELTPLRERPEDIPLLAAHFAQKAALSWHQPSPRLESSDLQRLAAHDWPGNERELAITVERAVILARGGPVRFDTPAVGPRVVEQRRAPTVAGDSAGAPTALPAEPLTREALRRLERQNIEAALAHAGGKVFGPGGAAEILAMKPTTLASRINALGITKPPRSRRSQK